MRRLLLMGLAVAACDDAVILEVHPAPGVATDKVQLYIGLGSCDDCPGIQPPQYAEILPGAVLYREAANERVREAKVEGGVARFRIEPGDGLDQFGIAVAVDANGQSAAVIQNLPLDAAGRYRVDLLPAAAMLGAKAAADGNFVAIWTQPNGPLQCMGFERWENGHLLGERIFIVPENDLDCDARTVNECAPYGFDALGLPAIEEATCTMPQPLVGDATVCMLGGPACDEVTGDNRACSPSEYCLPSRYCDLANPNCAIAGGFDLSRCLFGTPNPDNVVLQCTIGFEPASDNVHADACEGGGFELFSPMTTTSALRCEGPDGPLLMPKSTGALAFQDHVTFVTKDPNGRMWPLDVKLRHAYDCLYKLDVSGEKALAAQGPDPQPVFAQLWVSKSGGPARKLLVPLQLTYANDCSRPTQCVLRVDTLDSLARCLR